MELKNQSYTIIYLPENNSIICQGSVLPNGDFEYDPIIHLFNEAIQHALSQLNEQQRTKILTLDLKALEFLNSTGIRAMAKLVLQVREHEALSLEIIGDQAIPWQNKLLKNLQRLMPQLILK